MTTEQNNFSDEIFMRRALQLAAYGFSHAQPNPMVGCVIVAPDGRVIGQGWHRKCGQGHAEVNAVASVSEQDRPLLEQSTMYVTLEPCSHWGRTPPCARLILENKIPRVVVATEDPFARVHGRGLAMLRDGGVDVRVGILGEECRQLNAMFMTANEKQRPFVTLKWAQSADGYMDRKRTEVHPGAYTFSNAYTRLTAHRMRSAHQAILVGSETVLCDHPRLNVRDWTGTDSVRVVLDRSGRLAGEYQTDDTWLITVPSVAEALGVLYKRGIQSVLVEGGARVLRSFMEAGLWDCARVETAPVILGEEGTAPAPRDNLLPPPLKTDITRDNTVTWYSNNPLFTDAHPLCL